MIERLHEFDPGAPAIIIDVGNTCVEMATWLDGQVKTPLSLSTGDDRAIAEALHAHLSAMKKPATPPVVVGSVVPAELAKIKTRVEDALGRAALVIGENVALPIDVAVADKKAIGMDRVCAAAAAYETLQAACVVVDFGTAVTVDLVSEEGVLLGGAILPGPALQMRALHEHTAVLPQADPLVPQRTYGTDTIEAMRVGVCRGLAGAVRGLVEGYATELNRWPQVIATGGYLELMVPICDFLDTRVKHLVLRGIGVAYSHHIENLGT